MTLLQWRLVTASLLVLLALLPIHATALVGTSFAVARTSDFECTVNKRVEFPSIINNNGNGYDVATHQFVCPETGIYQFSFSALAAGGTWGAVSLIMGGQEIASGFSDSGGMIQQQSSSQTMNVECTAGTAVYVQCGEESFTLHQRGNYRINTFSGVRIA